MIEMLVRAVRLASAESAVVVLKPRVVEAYPRLTLAVPSAELSVIVRDLRARGSLSALLAALLARAVLGLHGRVTAVELLAADDGVATARLRLGCPSGELGAPIRVGQAIKLAVRLHFPLLVSRKLLRPPAAKRPTPVREPAEVSRAAYPPFADRSIWRRCATP